MTRLFLPSSTSAVRLGESLNIEFQSEPTLNRRVLVLVDGTISLPYVKTVKVAGLTPQEIEDVLDKAYKTIVQNPSIQVYRSDASQSIK